jgi:hypothetical protein
LVLGQTGVVVNGDACDWFRIFSNAGCFINGAEVSADNFLTRLDTSLFPLLVA